MLPEFVVGVVILQPNEERVLVKLKLHCLRAPHLLQVDIEELQDTHSGPENRPPQNVRSEEILPSLWDELARGYHQEQ